MMESVQLLISGHVQGVFYRGSVAKKARELNLLGFVRNCPDGTSVEIAAQGERSQLDELIAWCHKGPPGAIVQKVKVTWELTASEPYDSFKILH